MISFDLTEEQLIFRRAAADVARRRLMPAARQADEQGALAAESIAMAWDLGIVQAMADAGNAAIGQAAITNCLALEELAWGDSSAAMAIAASLGFVKTLVEQGTVPQKNAWLPHFSGNLPAFAALAMTDAGIAGKAPPCRAIKGPTNYVLTGTKTAIPLAAQCRAFLVTAQGEVGWDAFIVPSDTAGVGVRPTKTLGLRALELGDLVLDQVEVSAAGRLCGEKGIDLQRITDAARIALSAVMTGLSRAVYDFTLPYTKQRLVHGEVIARKQSVAFKLADMFAEVEAMHWMTLRAAAELDEGGDTQRNARLAQLYCADHAMWIADEGVQIFGGHGFVRDLPLEMWYRNARSLSVLEGMVGA